MKKIIFISIIVCFVISGYAQERFYDLYDGWTIDKVDTLNGNYITYGLGTHPVRSSTPHFNIIDIYGNQLEQFQYCDSLIPMDIQSAGAYLRDGDTLYMAGCYRDSYLKGSFLKYNISDRDVQNIIHYDTLLPYEQYVFYLLNTTETGFVIAGQYSVNANNAFPMIVFTDRDGNILSVKEYLFLPYGQRSKLVYPYQLLKLDDGGFIFTCQEDINNGTYGPEYSRIWFLRLDSEGNVIWKKNPYSIIVRNHPFAFKMPDGDFLLVWGDNPEGRAKTEYTGSLWMARMDMDGNIYGIEDMRAYLRDFETKTYYINDFYQDEDGNVFLAGNTTHPMKGFLMKINYLPKPVWLREYVCFPENITPIVLQYTNIYGLTPAPDGGFIMGGEFLALSEGPIFPDGIQKGLVIKTDECGCLEEDCNEDCYLNISTQYIRENKIEIYPNPAKDNIICKLPETGKKIQVEIFEISGSNVLNKEYHTTQGTGDSQLEIDIQDLYPGAYLVNIWTNGKLFSGKFVKN